MAGREIGQECYIDYYCSILVSSSQFDFRRFNLSLTSLKIDEISPRKHTAYKWLPRMPTYV